ncbi:hypothetical protein PTKIN_Ptkin19aG0005700 [Pterospermum kingtungense]
MAISWTGKFVLVLGVVVCVLEVPTARAGMLSPIQCKKKQRLLVAACGAVMFGHTPSSECCERVRATHVYCVCPAITPKLAALLGVERTIKQIEGCGRTVPRNFKCGSKI